MHTHYTMDITTRNRLNVELAAARTALQRNQKSYEYNQTDRCLENIHRLTDKIEILEKQLDGSIPCETVTVVKNSNDQTKVSKKCVALRNDNYIKKSYEILSTYDRSTPKPKDLERSEMAIEKASEKLSKNILEKLKTMPNNEGYVFRGVWFMGALPSNSDIITILDGSVKDMTIITKYTPDYELVYEKPKGQDKRLVSKKPRVFKVSSVF